MTRITKYDLIALVFCALTLVAALVPADEPDTPTHTHAHDDGINAWFAGLHQVNDLLDGEHYNPFDYGCDTTLLWTANAGEAGSQDLQITIAQTRLSAIKLARRGVTVWPVVTWTNNGDWAYKRLRNSESWRPYITPEGETINDAPCPTWGAYWRVHHERLAQLADGLRPLAAIEGIIIDWEMYPATQTRYTGPCSCTYSQAVGDQSRYVLRQAERIAERVDMPIGIMAGDAIDHVNGRPVGFYDALHAGFATQHAVYQFTESTYQSGLRMYDWLAQGAVNFGTWHDMWTDGGTRDVRFITGLWEPRVNVLDRDHRRWHQPESAIPGLHDVLALNVYLARQVGDGAWHYFPPHVIALDATLSPTNCLCRDGDCAGRDISVQSIFDALAGEDDVACEPRRWPDGTIETEVVDTDTNRVIRQIVWQGECNVPGLSGNSDCQWVVTSP